MAWAHADAIPFLRWNHLHIPDALWSGQRTNPDSSGIKQPSSECLYESMEQRSLAHRDSARRCVLPEEPVWRTVALCHILDPTETTSLSMAVITHPLWQHLPKKGKFLNTWVVRRWRKLTWTFCMGNRLAFCFWRWMTTNEEMDSAHLFHSGGLTALDSRCNTSTEPMPSQPDQWPPKQVFHR